MPILLLAFCVGCAAPKIYPGSMAVRNPNNEMIYVKYADKPAEHVIFEDKYESGLLAVRTEIREGRLVNAVSFAPNGVLQAKVIDGRGELKRFREDGTLYLSIKVQYTMLESANYYGADGANIIRTENMSWGHPPPPDVDEGSSVALDFFDPDVELFQMDDGEKATWGDLLVIAPLSIVEIFFEFPFALFKKEPKGRWADGKNKNHY